MSTGTTIAIVAGVGIFAIAAYLIVKQVSANSQFGDLTGLAASIL